MTPGSPGGGPGTADPADRWLRRAYRECRKVNSRHGKTFYLATMLLAPPQRPAIHALYGFARLADDIVDDPSPGDDRADTAARLEKLAGTLAAGLREGRSDDPVVAAVVDTAGRYGIEPALFDDFLASMRMDLTVTHYPDRAALDAYVHGSAEVIGLQVLPVLGTVAPRAEAAPYAAALGQAFQLTNFVRDIAEDLDRDRVYLPADELAAFGVDHDLLRWCRQHRRTERRVRAALAAQHATIRSCYAFARNGITLLHPVSRPCVATAQVLYSEILDQIERSDFAVFSERATVGRRRRAQVAAGGLARAVWARHGQLP